VIRSQQTSEAAGAGNANPSGVPGALSNQPPGSATAPLNGSAAPAPAGPAASPTRRDATTNYEVDKTVRYEQRPMGGVKRLTVGVVVNYRRIVDPKTGKVSARPLAAAEVAQINELVKQAMGYSQARGDSLNVTNAPFDGVDRAADAAPPVDWWRDPANLPFATQLAKYLFALLVIAFLWYRILRPLLRQALRKFDKVTKLPPEPEPHSGPDPVQLAAREEEVEVQKQAQGYRANLQMAKELAREDPRVVANVLKEWLGANE
jgi:flagellar M-ring protein FliF